MNKNELSSIGINWCLTTKRKNFKRSDILEVLGEFNDENVFPLFFILGDIEYVLDNYEGFQEV